MKVSNDILAAASVSSSFGTYRIPRNPLYRNHPFFSEVHTVLPIFHSIAFVGSFPRSAVFAVDTGYAHGFPYSRRLKLCSYPKD